MSDWRETTKREPCPVCEKPDWCSITGPEGAIEAAVCMRVESSNVRPNGGWFHQIRSSTNGYTPSSNGSTKSKLGEIVETYDYCDESGKLEFQVVRFEPKDFRQRKPKPDGGWSWSVKGCRVLPFRLSDLLNADPTRTVYIVEGEKDVLNLIDYGYVATCNAGGAGKWTDEHSKFLIGRNIVVLSDNDDPGRKHARRVKASLAKVGVSAKIVELPGLPEKGDVTDWLLANPNADLADVVACSEEVESDEHEPGETEETPRKPIAKYTFAELSAAFPSLNTPVVHGLFRQGETVNLIASPKVGKSWLGYHLALSIITGNEWLGHETRRGKVLLIDNELHPQTLAVRIPRVAEALELFPDDYGDKLDVWPLRGNLRPLHRLAEEFEGLEQTYQAILLDAKYRFGNGESENDNAAETALYNTLDQLASQTGAAIVLIHHATKGSQSDKRVTDVGAGAGAQSRAADCHIVLREHEDEGVFVLDAAVRSFKPVEPIALCWNFPLWRITGADTSLLKGRKPLREQQQDERDKVGMDAIIDFLRKGPATVRAIRASTGFGKSKVDRLLDKLTAGGHVTIREITIRGNICHEYHLV